MPVYGFRRWIIVFTVISAAVIELIDTSIVNVALSDMSGNLGASIGDIAWVVTAYTIANAIVIPITSFLAELFGRRRYYIGSILLFTLMSVLCGNAHSLGEIVTFRFIQGLGGGALLSTSQTILFETFEPREHGTAAGLFAFGIIFGPTIGPTLGGWIIDHYNWSWIFYVNLPIGLMAALLAFTFINRRPPGQRHKMPIDWTGISLLAVGIGALQYVLERGEIKDWFSNDLITVCAIIAFLALLAFVLWELHVKDPVVDLTVLVRSRSLAVAAVLTFIIGIGLFGSNFAVPIFAQEILGLSAFATGLLMLPGALAAMATAPITGRLMQAGLPSRGLAIWGFILLALFCWYLSNLTASMGPLNFFWPLILRGVGIASLSVPLITMAVSGLHGKDLTQGIALNNMMRQLGGSFGIALINTYVDRRLFVNRAVLVNHINAFSPSLQERVHALTQYFAAKGAALEVARQRAFAMIEHTLTQQSAIISYADLFRALAIFFFIATPLVMLMKKPEAGARATGSH